MLLQFPDDEDINCPRNVGLLAIQPPNAADRPRIFYQEITFFPHRMYTVFLA